MNKADSLGPFFYMPHLFRFWKGLLYIILVVTSINLELHAQPKNNSDSTKISRYYRHIASLDYISRKTDNGRYFLNLSNQYCDSILQISKDDEFALEFKAKNELILGTCEQNMNHMVQLFPFFNGFPDYMGFADDAVEYAYDDALGKLINTKYVKLSNGPLGTTNIFSIVISDNCDEEMFEIANQIIIKNTNHIVLARHELNKIIGLANSDKLIAGQLEEKYLEEICRHLELEKMGIFQLNDVDIINNKIWLVESKFRTYNLDKGINEPILTKGFIVDKRNIGITDVLLIILQSILLIALISFLSQFTNQSFRSANNTPRELMRAFSSQLNFVFKSFPLPFIFSYLMIMFTAIIMPNPEEHYMEFTAKLWLVVLTFSMSFVPTVINLYIINRLDLDGFHTIRGYRIFANTSLYATYLPIGLFYFVQYEHQYFTAQVVLIGVTLIIGDLLARSYYQYTAVTKNPMVKTQSFIGICIGIVGLIIVNSLILIAYEIENLVISILLIAPLSLTHYLLGIYFDRRYERQRLTSQEVEVFEEIPFITSVINPKKAIFHKAESSMSDEQLNIMLISGPAGIGKTRSLKESRANFIENNWEWFYGDCDEIQKETAVSFEPFLEAFSDLLKIEEFTNRGEQIDSAMGSAVDIGAAIVDIDTSSFVKDYSRNDSQKMTEICLEIIGKLEKRKKKVLFVMEDLHWIDPESYAFFKIFIQTVNRNKFARGNMCIILTIREDEYGNYRGPNLEELKDDLSNWQKTSSNKFELNELLKGADFNMKGFVAQLSASENKFSIQKGSLFLINELFNESLIENSSEEITPLYIIKVLEIWIDQGILVYSPEGYKLSRSIDTEDLPNESGTDIYYHSILSKYEDKWGRLLESAAIIGNRFNAELLAKVWNYELLEVLSFLERAVKDGLLIDVSAEDNIFMFGESDKEGASKRIVSAIKSYYSATNRKEYDKQIIIEYNKRYVDLHNEVFLEAFRYETEDLLILLRRLITLLISEPYKKKAETIVFELVLRLLFFREYEKLDSITSMLNKHAQFKKPVEVISKIIVGLDSGKRDANGLEGMSGIKGEKVPEKSTQNSNETLIFKLAKTEPLEVRLQTILNFQTSYFNFSGDVKIALEGCIEQVKENYRGVGQAYLALLIFNRHLGPKKALLDHVITANHEDQNITLISAYFQLVENKIARQEAMLENSEENRRLLDAQSQELINLTSSELRLKFLMPEIYQLRFEVLSELLDNDETAINELRARLIEPKLKRDIFWAKSVLAFLNCNSARIYYKQFESEAQVILEELEKIVFQYIDDREWNNEANSLYHAKGEFYLNTGQPELAIESLKKITNIAQAEENAERNLVIQEQYLEACDLIAKGFAEIKDGQAAVDWRLISIAAIKYHLMLIALMEAFGEDINNIGEDKPLSGDKEHYDQAFEKIGDFLNDEKLPSLLEDQFEDIQEVQNLKRRLSISYNNLSHTYRNLLNDRENTLKYAKFSLALKSPNEGTGYGVALYNIARAYDFKENHEEAINYYDQAKPFFIGKTNKEQYFKGYLELNRGISTSHINQEEGINLIKTAFDILERPEIKVYITKAAEERIEFAKALLK